MMPLQLCILLLGFLQAALSYQTFHSREALKARYEAHKDHYKLQFSGAENELRFEIYLANIREIEKHNAEKHFYKLAENEFTTLTTEEFGAYFLGARPRKQLSITNPTTKQKTLDGSFKPSIKPTIAPSPKPTADRTFDPSIKPTGTPSFKPSTGPSTEPSIKPTIGPTFKPSTGPSTEPSTKPTVGPSFKSSTGPSTEPSSKPTIFPTFKPSTGPSTEPSTKPSGTPTTKPSAGPSMEPSVKPTIFPSFKPSTGPSTEPSTKPSGTPTTKPSAGPSMEPSVKPTIFPSFKPSAGPSTEPSAKPSVGPSFKPSTGPSTEPSKKPTVGPSFEPSAKPTAGPSLKPTAIPSFLPSVKPSNNPTFQPSTIPSKVPSFKPSKVPVYTPSAVPTIIPTISPSLSSVVDWTLPVPYPNYSADLTGPFVTPAKLQGRCGSCYAFTSVAALESAYYLKYRVLYNFSTEIVVSCFPDQVNPYGCVNGGYPDDVPYYVNKNGGIPLLSTYPYAERWNQFSNVACNKTLAKRVVPFQVNLSPVLGNAGYLGSGTNAELLTQLKGYINQSPTTVYICGGSFAFKHYHSGVFSNTTCCTRGGVNHGVVAVGYGLDSTTGLSYIKIKNSWGASWGQKGFGLVNPSPDYCSILYDFAYPIVV